MRGIVVKVGCFERLPGPLAPPFFCDLFPFDCIRETPCRTAGFSLLRPPMRNFDSTYKAVHPIVRQGRYILLAVSDLGTGMNA